MEERKKIYAIMTVEDIDEDKPFPYTGFVGDQRIVGWYANKEEAFDSVKGNCCDMWETIYNYVVIEEICEGLYWPATKENRWFFKYNKDDDSYEQIEEPKCFNGFCGFTIG